MTTLDVFLNIAFPIGLILFAYFVGSYLERRHFTNIRAREQALHGYPVTSFKSVPDDWQVDNSKLMTGSVVISLDYFKRIIAGLRALIGGRVKTYEPLLDRARREALLRMVEKARAEGFDGVINVRLETSRLANARGNGEGTAGVEMLAFGTAVTFHKR